MAYGKSMDDVMKKKPGMGSGKGMDDMLGGDMGEDMGGLPPLPGMESEGNRGTGGGLESALKSAGFSPTPSQLSQIQAILAGGGTPSGAVGVADEAPGGLPPLPDL